MRQFLTFLLFFLMLLPASLLSQRNCASMEVLESQIAEDPGMVERMEAIEDRTQEFLDFEGATTRSVVTIPVVFHVIYKTNAQNLSDAQLQSQIDVLNEDFRRTNADQNNNWSQAADSEIEFCLASVDPNGAPTNGIQRKSTKKRDFRTNDAMKFASQGGIDAWPSGDYLNIWVCNISGGILGYAQFPGGNPASDGVVLDYAYTGRGGSAQAPFNLGRTGTHEVGHWLNLRHIWGDGGCSVDDFVADTPTSDAPNYGCASSHVSCSSLDMVQNYMDYSDDACMNLYTLGQKSRMQSLFAAGGSKESFLSSNGCGSGTPPTPSCTDGIQNGDETGVDCGGPDCDPCQAGPTCSDGIQNGDETGVDCGGSCANACPPPSSCDTPGNPFASNIKRNRTKLNWDAVTSATSYDVQIRTLGSSNWQVLNTGSSNITVSGLSNNTTYEWGVRANCGGTSSDYSATCTFTAGNSGSGACGNNRLGLTEQTMSIFPNPASTFLNVEMDFSAHEVVALQIVNIYGKVLVTENVAGNTPRMQLDVQNLGSGMYFLSVQSKEGVLETHRFIIAK